MLKRLPEVACGRSHCSVMRGDIKKGIPYIVHLPLIRNADYSEDFDPQKNAAEGFFFNEIKITVELECVCVCVYVETKKTLKNKYEGVFGG